MKNKFAVLLVIVAIGAGLAYSWWSQAVKPPNPSSSDEVKFSISPGEGIKTIADRLEKDGIIRSPLAFFLLARLTGLDSKIQAGDFRLTPTMSLTDVGEELTHGTSDVKITIPEGWRNEEIALKLAQEFGIPESEFLKLAKEGYMFPETYHIPKDASAAAVTSLFTETFQKKVTPALIAKAKAQGLTLEELVTIASLVEREARFAQDRPLVASVILNRFRTGMKLDIDATIQYAVGYQPETKTWWKKDLTIDDLAIDSPYNTYTNQGLPPGPIANPGIAAIEAVVNAPSTSHLFYLSDDSGKTYFADSLEEHNANIAKYLRR